MAQEITEEFIKSLTKWQILSLDCAQHTGFYSCKEYGTVYFPNTDKAPKKLGEDYEQHKAFRDWIIGMVRKHGFKMIAAEDVNVGSQFSALRKLAQFQGILYEVCATLKIPLVVVNVVSLKRFATGKGNANKQEMMEAAKKRWKFDCEGDDNLADAMHIFHYITKRYNIQ